MKLRRRPRPPRHLGREPRTRAVQRGRPTATTDSGVWRSTAATCSGDTIAVRLASPSVTWPLCTMRACQRRRLLLPACSAFRTHAERGVRRQGTHAERRRPRTRLASRFVSRRGYRSEVDCHPERGRPRVSLRPPCLTRASPAPPSRLWPLSVTCSAQCDASARAASIAQL